MKPIVRYVSLAAIAALPLATVTTAFGQVALPLGAMPQSQHVEQSWSDDQRQELRHVFNQLEATRADYGGHRQRAMFEIRRAAEAMGMELEGYSQSYEGSGYGPNDQPESQHFSDRTLRRDREKLMDLADRTSEPISHHLREAAHELDRALDTR